jgi:hypothetical protein
VPPLIAKLTVMYYSQSHPAKPLRVDRGERSEGASPPSSTSRLSSRAPEGATFGLADRRLKGRRRTKRGSDRSGLPRRRPARRPRQRRRPFSCEIHSPDGPSPGPRHLARHFWYTWKGPAIVPFQRRRRSARETVRGRNGAAANCCRRRSEEVDRSASSVNGKWFFSGGPPSSPRLRPPLGCLGAPSFPSRSRSAPCPSTDCSAARPVLWR